MENLDNSDIPTNVNSDEANKKVQENKTRKMTLIIIIVIACLMVIGSVIAIIIIFHKFGKDKDYDDGGSDPESASYGCMCDAGSSATRVNVFRWPKRKENTIPVITQIGRLKINSGIHKQSENELKATMNTLIDYCKNTINESSSNTTNSTDISFYLRATAGMRSISVEEQNKKLDIIRKEIKNSTLKFLNDNWVKVMSGDEEGLFGWITGNYLNRILFENEKAGKQVEIPYGSIDVGGYSLEITFTTNETIKEHKINYGPSNINYNIYSYSFDKYGDDKFIEIYLETLINSYKSEDSNIIINPCYLEGYNETYEYQNINYTIVGNPNITLCREIIRSILKINEEEEKSMNNAYQPKIPEDLKFYGVSALYEIGDFFNMADNEFHSASEFLNLTEEFCKKRWEDAFKEKTKNNEDDDAYIKYFCILGYYAYSFLAEGFKIDKDKKNIKFVDTIDGVKTGWALGAMSYEIELLPLQSLKNYLKHSKFLYF